MKYIRTILPKLINTYVYEMIDILNGIFLHSKQLYRKPWFQFIFHIVIVKI